MDIKCIDEYPECQAAAMSLLSIDTAIAGITTSDVGIHDSVNEDVDVTCIVGSVDVTADAPQSYKVAVSHGRKERVMKSVYGVTPVNGDMMRNDVSVCRVVSEDDYVSNISTSVMTNSESSEIDSVSLCQSGKHGTEKESMFYTLEEDDSDEGSQTTMSETMSNLSDMESTNEYHLSSPQSETAVVDDDDCVPAEELDTIAPLQAHLTVKSNELEGTSLPNAERHQFNGDETDARLQNENNDHNLFSLTRMLRSKSCAPAPFISLQSTIDTSADNKSCEKKLDLTAGCCICTQYGLGTVVSCSNQEVTFVVRLQSSTLPIIAYCRNAKGMHVIPALRHDRVLTPSGEGVVIDYMSAQRTYLIRIGKDVNANDSKKCGRIFFQHEVTRISKRPSAACHILSRDDVRKPKTFPETRTDRSRSIGACNDNADPTSNVTKSFFQGPSSDILSNAFKNAISVSNELSASTRNFVAGRALLGQYVYTSYGCGTITAYDQSKNVAEVELTADNQTRLIQINEIQHHIKVLIGMEVQTSKFGQGKVIAIRAQDEIYTVKLSSSSADQSEIVFVHETDLWKVRRTSVSNFGFSKLKFWKTFAEKL